MSTYHNRSTMGQKRTANKKSPLSKRPKLDFHAPPSVVPDPVAPSRTNPADRRPTTSDWDDDFAGDMLEKVCLIADLSQAASKDEPEVLQIIRNDKAQRVNNTDNSLANKGGMETLVKDHDRLLAENEKLKEGLKTREGEVQILRSQLKQYQEAKQADALHNVKVIEEMQLKFDLRLSMTTKECDSFKTRLQFKELEMKSLQERCRQIEYLGNSSRVKFNETVNAGSVQLCSASGTANSVLDLAGALTKHEGRTLARLVCPEIFHEDTEPNITWCYQLEKDNHRDLSRPDVNKNSYRWEGLPKQTHRLADMQVAITSLFLHKDLSSNDAKETVDKIFVTCIAVLRYHTDVLVFVHGRQTADQNDRDEKLLNNEDPVCLLTSRMLLTGARLHEDECGVEARRALAFMACVAQTSGHFLRDLGTPDFLSLLHDLVATIGNLRRPVRYSGTLAGVVLILKTFLEQKKIGTEILQLIQKILEEVIFARPKLDVFREVIRLLHKSCHHSELTVNLCRPDSVDTCASLYRDAAFKQTWFFTKDVCPLQLLCIQVMGLACLPCAFTIRHDVTNQVILWLMRTLDCAPESAWLSAREGRCCDVTKLVVFLLNLCVQDLESDTRIVRNDNVIMGTDLLSTIANGAVVLRRVMKDEERFLTDGSSQNLKFALGLRRVSRSERISEVQKSALEWVTEVGEGKISPSATPSTYPRLGVLRLREKGSLYF